MLLHLPLFVAVDLIYNAVDIRCRCCCCCCYDRSVDFFSDYGAQALSCPLARLPIARIAAAQSEIRATNRCKSIAIALCTSTVLQCEVELMCCTVCVYRKYVRVWGRLVADSGVRCDGHGDGGLPVLHALVGTQHLRSACICCVVVDAAGRCVVRHLYMPTGNALHVTHILMCYPCMYVYIVCPRTSGADGPAGIL